MRFLSDSYLRTGRKMVWEIQTSIPLSFTSIIWLIKKKRYGDYVSKNLICSFVSGPRKLWNLICTLKGVNKFDGEPYFTAKKIHSNYCAFCWKRTTFFGWCPMLFYHSKIYRLISEGVSDLHCMSDEYLAEELVDEYKEKWYGIDSNMCWIVNLARPAVMISLYHSDVRLPR